MVVLGEDLHGFRILGHGFGHQGQQRTGVDPVAVRARQINTDKPLERIQPWAPLRRPGIDQLHEVCIDETRQGTQQSGLVAEMMGRQATAVARLFAHLRQRHADPALARDDLPGSDQQTLFGLGATLELGPTRSRLCGFFNGFHRAIPY